MKNKDIRVNKITLIETPETDEALSILHMQEKKYDLTIFIFCGVILTFLLTAIFTFSFEIRKLFIFLFCFSIFGLIVFLIHRKSMLEPYYKLLKLARDNDKIRHEEKIRFREKTRLEEEYRKNNKLPTLPPRRPN